LDNLLFTWLVRGRYHYYYYYYYYYYYHVLITKLGHLLTRFFLTHPELSSIFFQVSLCILMCSISLSCATCYEPFCLHVCYISSVVLYFVLKWGYTEFHCNICISNMFLHAVVVLLPASLALIFQFSLSYNKAGRHGALYNFIFLFLKFLCAKHILYNVAYFQSN
jgi:hypothetical protein